MTPPYLPYLPDLLRTPSSRPPTPHEATRNSAPCPRLAVQAGGRRSANPLRPSVVLFLWITKQNASPSWSNICAVSSRNEASMMKSAASWARVIYNAAWIATWWHPIPCGTWASKVQKTKHKMRCEHRSKRTWTPSRRQTNAASDTRTGPTYWDKHLQKSARAVVKLVLPTHSSCAKGCVPTGFPNTCAQSSEPDYCLRVITVFFEQDARGDGNSRNSLTYATWQCLSW